MMLALRDWLTDYYEVAGLRRQRIHVVDGAFLALHQTVQTKL